MKGGVYPVRRDGVIIGWRVFFPGKRRLTRFFKERRLAEKMLTGLRFAADEGRFDERDYRRDNPLGFTRQVESFLESKRHLAAVAKYEQRLRHAVEAWGNRNVKTITYADIEDLLNRLQDAGLSSYYRKHIRDTLRAFFRWLVARREIRHEQMPEFPLVRYSMAYRKIIDKDTQERILEEIRRATYKENPRIWLACRMLATYIMVRPSELISIRERDIDLEAGRILVRRTKMGEPKFLYLTDDDRELIRALGRGFGELPFFRHTKGNGAAQPGAKFGKDFLYRVWRDACKRLGIEGVSLYPGTRHSSAVDLRQRHSPEAIRRATMHQTNKAFERYLQVTGDELREIYADTRRCAVVVQFPEPSTAKKS
ncbi:MAG: tyrosine-type recombinase/integrase [Desulfobacterales bacterium]